jgi:hypothetical protein
MDHGNIPVEFRLSTQEKCFMDELPQEALNTIYLSNGKQSVRVTGINRDGVFTIFLENPGRIEAAKKYINMLVELGHREHPLGS